MKIIIDLEAFEVSKQDWLLNTLDYAQIPFEKDLEEEWTEEEIKAYNKDLDEADAEFERGEFYSHEEVKKLMEKW
jgi:hypothetical protein